MFTKIAKQLKFLKFLKAEQTTKSAPTNYLEGRQSLHQSLDKNIAVLKQILSKCDDLIFREFYFGVKQPAKAFVCFIDGLGDKKIIDEYIVKSLMVNIHITDPEGRLAERHSLKDLKDHILNIVEAFDLETIDEAVEAILEGDTLLLIDGSQAGLAISARGEDGRPISEPETEVVIRGSREAFVETLRVNTALLRRIIKNPNLKIEDMVAGRQSRTDICLAYLDGIANEKVVEEVHHRIQRIDIDAILESGYIEQLIDDNPFSPFSTVGNSERPDKIAAKLLEGRVAIFCSGTPIVLTVPYTFVEALQVPEDYYSRPFLTNFIRVLRLLAFFVTLTLPAIYIALTTYHQEMLPTILLITFAAAREGIPFPVFLETLISETIFQLLRESGIRMPRAVGTAVSIVGTLVIGEAAVNAGIIGAPMVIITALSAITSFILPPVYDAILIFKFLLIFLSGAFGLYGVLVGMLCMLAHMCSLRSFGTPYMAPVAPLIWSDLKDSIARIPIWLMQTRPKSITWGNSERQAKRLMPNKPERERGKK